MPLRLRQPMARPSSRLAGARDGLGLVEVLEGAGYPPVAGVAQAGTEVLDTLGCAGGACAGVRPTSGDYLE
jgi:hypothetical protein